MSGVRKRKGAAEDGSDKPGKKRGPGRPSKKTPELVAAIVARVERGNYPEVAAQAEGISRTQHYAWMRTDDDYRTQIARACAAAEAEMLDAARTGDAKGESFGQAKAALEVLGRRFPKRWSQKIKHELDESNRLMVELLGAVCARSDVFDRVREAGDCGPVFEVFCEELTRLDSEGEALDPEGGEVPALH